STTLIKLLFLGLIPILFHPMALGRLIIESIIKNRTQMLPESTVTDERLLSELTVGSQGVYLEESPLWLFLPTPHSSSYLYMINAITLSITVLAFCLLLGRVIQHY